MDVLGGTLPKSIYLELLTSKFALSDCLKVMMVIVRYTLKKKGIVLLDIMLEAEA